MADKTARPGRLVVPTLFIQSLSSQSGQILTSLLLIEIAATYGATLGEAAQIRTASAITATLFSVIMAALSIAYNHKKLYMLGSLAFVISGIASPLSPSLGALLIAYSLTGIGAAVTAPMSNTLIATLYPPEKRSGAIGWSVAGMSVSYVVGTIAIAYLSTMGGWKLAFWMYTLPLYVVGFIMVLMFMPDPGSSKSKIGFDSVLQGFRSVLGDRSAALCLVGYAFSIVAWQFDLLYGVSLIRTRFSASTYVVSAVVMATALSFTAGSLLGGRFVNAWGRKRVTVVSIIIVGLLTLAEASAPFFGFYVFVSLVLCFVSGVMFTAFRSLLLELVPSQRGVMMSISNASMQLGVSLGTGIGGFVLSAYDYWGLGLVLGLIGLLGGLVVAIFVAETSK